MSNISTTYNGEGNHEAVAVRKIDGEEYSVTCLGLASCGEPLCDPDRNPFDSDEFDSDESEQHQAWQELRQAAVAEVKRYWNYNGSEWSEPVDDPDIYLAAERDDEHPVEITQTEFHGGATVGYARDQAEAEAWIAHRNQGTDCVCGCYEIISADE